MVRAKAFPSTSPAFVGWRWAVFSPVWEHCVADCAAVYSGKPFSPAPGVDSMTATDLADAEAWPGERITMLDCDAEDSAPTPDRFRGWGRRDASTILDFAVLAGRSSSPISNHASSDALAAEADRWPE